MGEEEVKVKYHYSTDIGTWQTRERTLRGGAWYLSYFFDDMTHAECREHYKSRDFVLTVEVEMIRYLN